MMQHAVTLGLLLLLSGASLIAFWTFAVGFVSTRLELSQRSTQQDQQHVSYINGSCISKQNASCGHSPTPHFDRVVLLVADALRVDMMFAADGCAADPAIHVAQMPKMAALLQDAGPAATALKFVADVPTITMSRLKALLTGSMPTFLDIGKSFSASAITEDNLLLQLLEQGKRMVVMGDDTWMQMAPWAFDAGAHPFPSFNVLDLHTVDEGVIQHLLPYLSQEHLSWDFLVGHFLGIDHAGHSHGVLSTQMRDKIRQVDGWLAQAAEMLLRRAGPGQPYERTLLLVLGDHAQTLTGDHGGGSHDETDSLLLAFNMGKWSALRQSRQRGTDDGKGSAGDQVVEGQVVSGVGCEEGMRESNASFAQLQPGCESAVSSDALAPERLQLLATNGWVVDTGCNSTTSSNTTRCCSTCTMACTRSYEGTMPQVDFAASLAVSLGVPIPYGNVGKVDPSWWAMAHPLAPVLVSQSKPRACSVPQVERGSACSGETVSAQLQSNTEDGGAAAGGAASTQLQHDTEDGCQRGGDACTSSRAGNDGVLGIPQPLVSYLDALQYNAWQAHRYLNAYAQHASLGAELEASNRMYQGLTAGRATSKGSHDKDAEQLLLQSQLLLNYLEQAAQVARDKFCGMDLTAMVVGCMLMIASLAMHLGIFTRLFQAPWLSLVRVDVIAALSLVAFQACSLFGVTWMMAEGRVVCACVTLLVLVLWASALHSLHRGSHTALAQAAGSSVASKEQDSGEAVTGEASTCSWPSGWWPWVQALLAGPVGVISSVLLQRLGLIDRSGQDPHDKSQPQAVTDLLGYDGQPGQGADGLQGREQLLAWVTDLMATGQMPLLVLALPAVLAACHGAIARGLQGRRRVQRTPAGAAESAMRGWPPGLHLPCWLLMAACMVEHACVAAWWLARSLGKEEQSLSAIWHAGQAWPRNDAAARICTLLEQVWIHGGLQALMQRVPAAATAWCIAAAALPLRLLLPRVVYGAAGSILAIEVVTGLLRLVMSRRRRRPSSSSQLVGRYEAAVRAGRHIWLLGCLCAPVMLLLGRRGPATMLCGTLLLASMTVLCCILSEACVHSSETLQQSPSPQLRPSSSGSCVHESWVGTVGLNGPTAAPGDEAADTAADGVGTVKAVWGATCPIAWAMTGMMLFYCTGHFCEFSGLQYTSPFIGFDDMEWYVSAALLTTNTFGATALTSLAMPLLACLGESWFKPFGGSKGDTKAVQERAASSASGLLPLAVTSYCMVRLLTACTAVLCATVLHKSVVVWAIIAPKVVFEMFFLGVNLVMLFLGVIMSV